jgi:hypothetical protein
VTQPAVQRGGSVVVPTDADSVVRLRPGSVVGKKPGQAVMCFDEAYFRTLERMQWNRDNGFVELMPIIVGMP